MRKGCKKQTQVEYIDGCKRRVAEPRSIRKEKVKNYAGKRQDEYGRILKVY